MLFSGAASMRGLQFGRLRRELLQLLVVPERLGVQHDHPELRAELAEPVHQVFDLLGHLLLGGLRVRVAGGRERAEVVRLMNDDRGGRGRAQLAQFGREFRREREPLVAGGVVAAVVGERIGVHEDQERDGRDHADGRRGAGEGALPDAEHQPADDFHDERDRDRGQAAHEQPRGHLREFAVRAVGRGGGRIGDRLEARPRGEIDRRERGQRQPGADHDGRHAAQPERARREPEPAAPGRALPCISGHKSSSASNTKELLTGLTGSTGFRKT